MTIAAFRIRAEMTTAQADYVISILESLSCLYKINQTNLKRCRRRLIMLCCSRMSLEHTTEMMGSVSGHFIKWSSCKAIKRDMRLPENLHILITSWTKFSTTC